MSVKAAQLEITSPCPITLDRSAVSAEDKAMFCAHCTKDVHLLSSMTEGEARELMKAEAGRDICVSYATRSDGSIRFREPQLVPPTALRLRAPARAASKTSAPRRMSMVAALGAGMLLAACTAHGEAEMLGDVQASPVIEDTTKPDTTKIEIVEEIPCEREIPTRAGGLRATPLPEPTVDGGLRAMPLPEPTVEPVVEPVVEPAVEIGTAATQHVRGGLRARDIRSDDDPLARL